jgi:hypothetical protein
MHTHLPRTLALATAGVLLLGGCGADPAPASGGAAPTRGTDRPDRPGKGEDSPTVAPSSEGGGGSTTVAVYYVGDTERAGPRLYREFQRGEGEALDAGVAALTGSPLDPDYRTLWQPDQLLGASYDGDVIVATVDPAVRARPAGVSRAEAAAAVEQVVYTLQAAVQERAPVQFRSDDDPIDQVFGVPTAEPVAQGDALDVLSHVSLTSPEEGAVVDDGTLEVSGVGNSFEANLGWEVRQGDRVVTDGYATLEGYMEPRLFPFETSVDVSGLDPGEYTLWVTTDDPSGGEGVGAMTDDRTFVLE